MKKIKVRRKIGREKSNRHARRLWAKLGFLDPTYPVIVWEDFGGPQGCHAHRSLIHRYGWEQ